MSGIEFNVDAALAKLGELVSKHGPQAVDLAAEVVRIEAVGSLVRGAALAVLAICLGFGSWRIFRWSMSGDGDGGEAGACAAVLGGFDASATGFAAALPFLNVWNWVALTNPKLALAHTILAKLAAVANG